MVRTEELQEWTKELCKGQGLPVCDTMVYIDMDDYVGIIGEEDGGCLVVYEVCRPERYCVAVEKSVLQNRELVYDTLQRQIKRYKKFLEE